ncbi:MAG TPA: kinase [Elusimicrobiota bacterium]|nr:kinase [Elusimicrobiota bacterium]
MIISRTPFRISFFGGGTDYPIWYNEHGGSVLATTIDKYCYISCRHLPPFFTHKSRMAYSKIELLREGQFFEHPSARETLKFMEIEEGVEIHHDADLPARTGLGSSSSFTVGLLHTLYALKQRMPTKMQLAEEAIHIERDLIKECVGSQDQVSAAFGGFNRIDFNPGGTIRLQPVIVARERLNLLQDHLMLYFTGFSRLASVIAEKQVEDTHKKSRELKAMHQMVDHSLSLLTGRGDLTRFGELLHESWTLKRSLTDRVSTPEIDEIYAAAREAGAVGGKLLGAGGGGFILLFARPEDQPRIKDRLKHLLHVPFSFENGGSQIIFYDYAAYGIDRSAGDRGASKPATARN